MVDLRWPIGIIFTIYGVILIVFGALASPAIFEKSMGVNIDVWWGLALLVFGLFMAALAFRATRHNRS
jgi:membrane-bound ClpP family serine protease